MTTPIHNTGELRPPPTSQESPAPRRNESPHRERFDKIQRSDVVVADVASHSTSACRALTTVRANVICADLKPAVTLETVLLWPGYRFEIARTQFLRAGEDGNWV